MHRNDLPFSQEWPCPVDLSNRTDAQTQHTETTQTDGGPAAARRAPATRAGGEGVVPPAHVAEGALQRLEVLRACVALLPEVSDLLLEPGLVGARVAGLLAGFQEAAIHTGQPVMGH